MLEAWQGAAEPRRCSCSRRGVPSGSTPSRGWRSRAGSAVLRRSDSRLRPARLRATSTSSTRSASSRPSTARPRSRSSGGSLDPDGRPEPDRGVGGRRPGRRRAAHGELPRGRRGAARSSGSSAASATRRARDASRRGACGTVRARAARRARAPARRGAPVAAEKPRSCWPSRTAKTRTSIALPAGGDAAPGDRRRDRSPRSPPLSARRPRSAGAPDCTRADASRRTRLPLPSISVGNLTFGGTGKTPFVEFLARRFRFEGWRPAILSRGYGRRTRGVVVVSAGDGPLVTPDDGGDEPVALARAAGAGIVVVVGERRADAAQRAAELGADLLLLDDGYQHLAVRRDVNLLLLDSRDPFGGRAAPAGGPPPRAGRGGRARRRASSSRAATAAGLRPARWTTIARLNPGRARLPRVDPRRGPDATRRARASRPPRLEPRRAISRVRRREPGRIRGDAARPRPGARGAPRVLGPPALRRAAPRAHPRRRRADRRELRPHDREGRRQARGPTRPSAPDGAPDVEVEEPGLLSAFSRSASARAPEPGAGVSGTPARPQRAARRRSEPPGTARSSPPSGPPPRRCSALPRSASDAASRRPGRSGAARRRPRRRTHPLANLRPPSRSGARRRSTRLARGSAEALGVSLMEFLEVASLSGEEIRRRFEVVGEENLRAARARAPRRVPPLGALRRLGARRDPRRDARRADRSGRASARQPSPRTRARAAADAVRQPPDRQARRGARRAPRAPAAGDGRHPDRPERAAAGGRLRALLRPARRDDAGAGALPDLKTGAAVVPVFAWPRGRRPLPRSSSRAAILAEEFQAESDRDEAVRRATARYMAVTEAAIRGSPPPGCGCTTAGGRGRTSQETVSGGERLQS